MPAGSARSRTWSEWFCLVGGGILLLRGLVGFVALDASFATPGEGWHHLIHLGSGLLLLGAATLGAAPARAAAFAFGAGYGALALAGIADGDDAFGLIAADALDKTFHVLIAAASLLSALRTPGPAARGAPA